MQKQQLDSIKQLLEPKLVQKHQQILQSLTEQRSSIISVMYGKSKLSKEDHRACEQIYNELDKVKKDIQLTQKENLNQAIEIYQNILSSDSSQEVEFPYCAWLQAYIHITLQEACEIEKNKSPKKYLQSLRHYFTQMFKHYNNLSGYSQNLLWRDVESVFSYKEKEIHLNCLEPWQATSIAVMYDKPFNLTTKSYEQFINTLVNALFETDKNSPYEFSTYCLVFALVYNNTCLLSLIEEKLVKESFFNQILKDFQSSLSTSSSPIQHLVLPNQVFDSPIIGTLEKEHDTILASALSNSGLFLLNSAKLDHGLMPKISLILVDFFTQLLKIKDLQKTLSSIVEPNTMNSYIHKFLIDNNLPQGQKGSDGVHKI